jgi:hypothetical protein
MQNCRRGSGARFVASSRHYAARRILRLGGGQGRSDRNNATRRRMHHPGGPLLPSETSVRGVVPYLGAVSAGGARACGRTWPASNE